MTLSFLPIHCVFMDPTCSSTSGTFTVLDKLVTITFYRFLREWIVIWTLSSTAVYDRKLAPGTLKFPSVSNNPLCLDPSVSTKSNHRVKNLGSEFGLRILGSEFSLLLWDTLRTLKSRTFCPLCQLERSWPCLVRPSLSPENQDSSQPYNSEAFSSPFAHHFPFRVGSGSFLCMKEVLLKCFFSNYGRVFLSVQFCQRSW